MLLCSVWQAMWYIAFVYCIGTVKDILKVIYHLVALPLWFLHMKYFGKTLTDPAKRAKFVIFDTVLLYSLGYSLQSVMSC